MVEAVIVLPVLVTCLGAMMYAGGARYQKQAQQQRAREGVLTYATNACKSGGIAEGGGSGEPSLRERSPSVDPERLAIPNKRAYEAVQAATDLTIVPRDEPFGAAVGGPPDKPWTWAWGRGPGAIPDDKALALSGHSFYLCNEDPRPSSLDTLLLARKRAPEFLR
jgi:hypothetical protein